MPIPPRLQSFDRFACCVASSKNGLSSSWSTLDSVFPSHSQIQHSCLRSFMQNVVDNATYLASDRWFRTLRTTPVSEDGDPAEVASAWDSACCRLDCMEHKCDRCSGKGPDLSLTGFRETVAGGVGGAILSFLGDRVSSSSSSERYLFFFGETWRSV
jgi:hypothetical protein